MHIIEHRYGNNISAIIHLAAYYSFSGKPSPLYERLTVQGTQRLLRELARFEVGRFIFSSSMLVHAPSEPGVKIDENSPIAPAWDYPKSKVKAEEAITSFCGEHNMAYAILRIAGVYDDLCHSIPLAQQIQRIYEQQLTAKLFPGDQSHGQSFLHLDDLVSAFIRLVQTGNKLPRELILLLGEPTTVSYGTLQVEISRLLHGRPQKTLAIPPVVAKAGASIQDAASGGKAFIKPWMIEHADDHYELDISAAERLLDWHPQHDLLSSLETILENLRHDPAAWYKTNNVDVPDWLKSA
jgi:nucleoside-diphosphate-sugar epimerase